MASNDTMTIKSVLLTDGPLLLTISPSLPWILQKRVSLTVTGANTPS